MKYHILAFGAGFYWIRSLAIPIFCHIPSGNRLVDREDRKSTAQWQPTGRFPGERGSGAQTGEAFGGNCFAAYGNVYGIDPGGSICTYPRIGMVVEAVMTYQILAARCLQVESGKVWKHLKAGNPEAAREAVVHDRGKRYPESYGRRSGEGCHRDCGGEHFRRCDRADAVYGAGRPVLGFLYKAVNTMDSMVGYKNDRYLHFGRAAAKLDDVVNFLPARISAL